MTDLADRLDSLVTAKAIIRISTFFREKDGDRVGASIEQALNAFEPGRGDQQRLDREMAVQQALHHLVTFHDKDPLTFEVLAPA